MNLTDYIAIYGAALSTIAIGWNVYNNLQDRPKIKIQAKFGFTSSENGSSENLLIITAINKGKRSVYLLSMGLRSGDEDLINTRTRSLPYELKGGDSHSESFELHKIKNRQFDFAWYRDKTGRLYKSKSVRKKLDKYFKGENDNKTFKGELTE